MTESVCKITFLPGVIAKVNVAQLRSIQLLTERSAWAEAIIGIDGTTGKEVPHGYGYMLLVQLDGGQTVRGGYTVGIMPNGDSHS